MSTPDALLLLLTGACFVTLVVAARLPVSLSLAASSVVLAFAAGRGFPLGHLVEGMFSYLDVSLVLFAAMVFMKVIEANGLLTELTQSLIAKLGGSRILLLVALTIVMSPAGPAAQDLQSDEAAWRAFMAWFKSAPPVRANPFAAYAASL
jgi:Na+/H+ antiporter NhaD/arsenite permease-like protein